MLSGHKRAAPEPRGDGTLREEAAAKRARGDDATCHVRVATEAAIAAERQAAALAEELVHERARHEALSIAANAQLARAAQTAGALEAALRAAYAHIESQDALIASMRTAGYARAPWVL